MSVSAPSSMSVSREELNPCTVKLTITCSPEQVSTGVRKAAKSLSKRVRVPGFRPGTAPISVLEQFLSPSDIDSLAKEETVEIAYKKAVEEEGLQPVGQPVLSELMFDRAAAKCTFAVTIPLAPKVKLGEYKGLAVDKFRIDVSDNEVERQIDEMRSRSGTKKAVKRGIKVGDNALINIKVDGEEGDGRNFMVVAGQTFEDLDKSLEGMEPDEIKSTTLKFPDAFQEKDLAGTETKCIVTVRNVSAVEIPELDDEFAKSMNLENVETLKERVREYIRGAKEQMATEMVSERLLEQVMAGSEVHVSDTAWEGVAGRRIANMKEELEGQGATLEQYAQQHGMDEPKLFEAVRSDARTQVQRAVLISEIFSKEGLKVTNEDLNRQFLRILQENQVPEAEIKRFAKENARQIQEEAYSRTMYAKVADLLQESANITEVDPPTGQGNA